MYVHVAVNFEMASLLVIWFGNGVSNISNNVRWIFRSIANFLYLDLLSIFLRNGIDRMFYLNIKIFKTRRLVLHIT